MAINITSLPYYEGFGYRYNGNYFADQAQLDDWLQRDAARTQANKDNDAALLRQWGAPSNMNVWDAAGEVYKANYNNYGLGTPSTPGAVAGGAAPVSTSWGYTPPAPTYNPPSTSWSTSSGANTPAPGSSVSVPQPNTSGQGGSNGFLPDYYQTGNNPYRGTFQDNNPNLRSGPNGTSQLKSYGQLPYLMS